LGALREFRLLTSLPQTQLDVDEMLSTNFASFIGKDKMLSKSAKNRRNKSR
jgi:hypothetical protein